MISSAPYPAAVKTVQIFRQHQALQIFAIFESHVANKLNVGGANNAGHCLGCSKRQRPNHLHRAAVYFCGKNNLLQLGSAFINTNTVFFALNLGNLIRIRRTVFA